MLKAVNAWEDLTAARLLDFFRWGSHWNRGLWNPGLILTLKEVLEASAAARASILSEEALNFVIGVAAKTAAQDPGVGDRANLKALEESLRPKLRFDGLDYLALSQLTKEISQVYLARWAANLKAPPQPPNPERVARAIASHLLDEGFSSDFLHRWWTFQLHYEPTPSTLGEIVDRAHALASGGLRSYDVLLAFDSVTREKFGRPDGWIDGAAVATWLHEHGFDSTNIRQYGGLVVSMEARDAGAAVDAAVDALDNLAARARIATGRELGTVPVAWVAGESKPYQISRRNRGVNVRALLRQNVVYRKSGAEDAIDAAFEMLALLQRGSPTAAIAGGWAAIEALLSEPNDRGGAADRLGALVACSFPRAELTQLSYTLEKSDAALGTALAGVTENRLRCEVLAKAILAGNPITAPDRSDDAAIERMRLLLLRPTAVLQDIQTHASIAFRRVYRQRNLVLHGGKTNAVALRACLRTAAPLVGAGMDRLAHAYYVMKMLPLATAAHARIAITTATSRGPLSCLDLLP